MLTKVVTLEYFFISYKKWATKLYIVDRKYFTNLNVHNDIIIQDIWTSCIPLISAESNA